MAPSRRENPPPHFASNTPQALAHLLAYNAYGDPRWTRLAFNNEAVEETTPLLVGPVLAWDPSAQGVTEAPAPAGGAETDEVGLSVEGSMRSESTVDGDESVHAPISFLSRVLAFLRALLLRLRALFAPRSPSSPILPLFSSPGFSSPPSAPLHPFFVGPVPSSEVDSEDFAPYSPLSDDGFAASVYNESVASQNFEQSIEQEEE